MNQELLQKGADQQQLENSESVTITNAGLTEISPMILQKCSKLRYLNLNHNQIKAIENLQAKQLQGLSLAFNEIASTVGLQDLISLTSLNLSYNQIQNLTKLGQMKNLQQLRLGFNQLEKVSIVSEQQVDGLENLRELRILDLSGNSIQKIDFLIYNSKLEELYLQKNRISNLSAKDFSNCPGIQIMNLSSNEISSFSFINALPELQVFFRKQQSLVQELYVSQNRITDLGNLKPNENLEIIDLSSNKIMDPSRLEYKFRNLTHLYLQDNDILAEYNLTFLTNMNNMIEVNFLENPCYDIEFETKLIIECPWLELVNGKEVGKPANYLIKEIKNIREELDKEEIDFEQFTFADINDEVDVVTEEKFKAILRQKGIEDEEEEAKPLQTDRSTLIFQDKDELSSFIDERNKEALEIRQRYLSIFNKHKKKEKTNDDNILIEQDSTILSETKQGEQMQTDNSPNKDSSLSRFQTKPQQMSIRKINTVQRQSLPPSSGKVAKASILQEISQIKTIQQQKDFQVSLGITEDRQKLNLQIHSTKITQKTLQPINKMNLSSENFNQRKKDSEQSITTMNLSGRNFSQNKYSQDSSRPGSNQKRVKLPSLQNKHSK